MRDRHFPALRHRDIGQRDDANEPFFTVQDRQLAKLMSAMFLGAKRTSLPRLKIRHRLWVLLTNLIFKSFFIRGDTHAY
jgi:hypothetical protein